MDNNNHNVSEHSQRTLPKLWVCQTQTSTKALLICACNFVLSEGSLSSLPACLFQKCGSGSTWEKTPSTPSSSRAMALVVAIHSSSSRDSTPLAQEASTSNSTSISDKHCDGGTVGWVGKGGDRGFGDQGSLLQLTTYLAPSDEYYVHWPHPLD